MRRTLLIAALTALPLGAVAQNPICAPSGAIVQAAVEARSAGQDAATAITTISDGLPEDNKNYKPAVPPLVEWVYTLPEEQLGAGVAEAYVAACEAQ
ncbi:MAG: DNA primase [Rhodobacteraceae bacterium CG17_big_fil_post_rev_8_21_14_2_50_63_15]|nr:DNA primase [Roseovarius sp.]PIV78975.1 MAG: DNA primase [Rhodobacteraceae bacterium CG17_big_fil_post_rev_8_21_14_2_50_63_15]